MSIALRIDIPLVLKDDAIIIFMTVVILLFLIKIISLVISLLLIPMHTV